MTRARTLRLARLLALGVAAAASSCASAPPTTGICRLPRATPGLSKTPRPEEWFRFLVDRGLDGGTADCSGASVRWRAPASCQETDEPAALLPPRPFREGDLIEAHLTPTTRLVWAVTDHYASGEGLGPVALVEEGNDGFDVLAVGSLRARPGRAHLSLESLGASTYLVAEGESCAVATDPATCTRNAVLLRKGGDRFEPATLVDHRGACVSPARFFLTRRDESSLGTGGQRRFELSATLEFQRDQLVSQEQVLVSDADPRQADVPPTVVRRVDEARVIRALGGRLVVDDVSLWTRVRSAAQAP
jgi:hypothetical protein